MNTPSSISHVSGLEQQEIFHVTKQLDPDYEEIKRICMQPIPIKNNKDDTIIVNPKDVYLNGYGNYTINHERGLGNYISKTGMFLIDGHPNSNDKIHLNTGLLRDGVEIAVSYDNTKKQGWFIVDYKDKHEHISLEGLPEEKIRQLQNIAHQDDARLIAQKDNSFFLSLGFGHIARLDLIKIDEHTTTCNVTNVPRKSNESLYRTASGDIISRAEGNNTSNYVISKNSQAWKNNISSSNGRIRISGDAVFAIDPEKVILNDTLLAIPQTDNNTIFYETAYNADSKTWYVSKGNIIYAGTTATPSQVIETPAVVERIFADAHGNVACVLWNGKNYLLRQKGFSIDLPELTREEIYDFTFDHATNTFTGSSMNKVFNEKYIYTYRLNPNAAEVVQYNTRKAQEQQSQQDILALLANEGISTLEQMKQIVLSAKEHAGLQNRYNALWEEFAKLKQTSLQQNYDISSLQKDKKLYVQGINTLLNKIEHIKQGIKVEGGIFKKGLYSISENAQKNLGIHPKENYPLGASINQEDSDLL